MRTFKIIVFFVTFFLSSCAKDIVDLTGDIKGTVKDYKSGELISNCGVSLSPGGKSTSTDQYGVFSFNELAPGDYTLTLTKSGYDDETRDVTVVTGQTSTVSVLLKERTSSTGSIIGSVKDYDDARLLSNCQVSLSPGGKTYATSSDGKYEFNGLAPGEYSLSFSKSGYNEDSKSVTVKAGEVTTADCLLKSKSSFSLSESNYDFGDLEDNRTFHCYNNSASDCSYSISNIPEWLSFSKTEGTVKYDSNDSFTVTVDRSKVGEGTYTQTVIVAFSGSNSGTATLKLSMKKVVITAPNVSTGTSATNVTQNSFDISGLIVATGGAQIIEYGHCWSTSPSPTVNDRRTNLGMTDKSGSFVSNVSGLTVNTTYYVRAYAKNSQGISYSDQITVTTQDTGSDKWDGTKASSFAGGSGTRVDPYQIKTGSQLVLIKDYTNKCFILCNNINLNNLSWPGFDFSGTFDGNGCTISNLKITRTDDNLGLFSKVTGTVKNLSINGVDIQSSTSDCIGAITGRLTESGKISNCSIILNSNSKILGNNYVGGAIGYYDERGTFSSGSISSLSQIIVSSASSSNVILGNRFVGGIAGLVYCESISIENCHTNARIYGDSSIGGICGEIKSNYIKGNISNCSFNGKISGNETVGGILGDLNASNQSGFSISGCKVDASINIETDIAGGICGSSEYESIKIYACYTTGNLSCSNSSATVLGGIMGYNEEDCYLNLCYSTLSSNHDEFNSLIGDQSHGFTKKAEDCASIFANLKGTCINTDTSCENITDFLHSCYSDYASYYNFNNTWTWTGEVAGITKSISCPKLAWE